jgi:hypothetical protein
MQRLFSPMVSMTLLSLAAISTSAQSKDAGADPTPNVQQLLTWDQCSEYLPSHKHSGCRVDFDMKQTKDGKTPPQTHKDITVHLGPDTRGVVVLWHSSPFAACSLTTQPGPLARDLSTNAGGALTSAGGLKGFPLPAALPLGSANITFEIPLTTPASVPPENLAATQVAEITRQIQAQQQQTIDFSQRITGQMKPAEKAKAAQDTQAKIQAEIDLEKEKNRQEKITNIEEQEAEITKLLKGLQITAHVYDNIKPDLDDVAVIRKNLEYSYDDDGSAKSKIAAIESSAVRIVGLPLPDNKTIATLQTQRDAVDTKVTALEKANPNVPSVATFVAAARVQIKNTDALITTNQDPQVVALVAYMTDTQAKVQKIMDFVRDWRAQAADPLKPVDASVQVLPIALYSESKVAVTVKCTDAVTLVALFDGIQFNAYFQRPPIFDISSGVIISTLHGRQVATQAAYNNPSSTNTCPPTSTTASSCAVIVINRTRPQFMPGVFAELHWWNFKLPGVHDPAKDVGNPPGRIPTWMSDNAPRHPIGYVGSLGLAGGFMVNPNNGTTQAEFFEGISFGMQRFVFLIGNHNGRSQNLTNGYYVNAPVASGTTPTTVSNWSNALAFGITYRIPLR